MTTTDTADEQREATLRALGDTVIPSIARDDDPDGFWARCDRPQRRRRRPRADGDAAPGAASGPGRAARRPRRVGLPATEDQAAREAIVRGVAQSSAAAAIGMASLVGLIQFLHYGVPDPATGLNANWGVFGYPGPPAPRRPDVPKPISPVVPHGDATLDADVCVVGSGAGGGVIAGRLAQEGLRVVVLEAGGYFNESDFSQFEVQAYQDLYWRGGPGFRPPTPTSRCWRARRSAAARSSTGPTACARPTGCAASGPPTTASRDSTAPTSTPISTRCWSASGPPTSSATTTGRTCG